MKKFEVKKIGVKSMFKVTMYMMVVPAIFMLLAGILMIVFGGDPMLRVMGIVYVMFPVLIVVLYGPLAMLMALLYNVLAKKFGGLKIELAKSKSKKDVISDDVDNDTIEF